MSRTISRIGVGVAATALVFGAAFAVAGSASAAETIPTDSPAPSAPPVEYNPNLDSTTTTFAAGNWGEGITASGTGFGDLPEGATVTVVVVSGPFADPSSAVEQLKSQSGVSALADVGGGFTEYGETPVTPDASGAFQLTNWIPQELATPLADGDRAILAALVDFDGDPATEEDVDAIPGPFLTITPFVPLAQSFTITPTCSTVDGIATNGIHIAAAGFGQFETLSASTVGPSGEFDIAGDAPVTDGTGSIEYDLQLTSGVENGEYVQNLLGQTSGVSLATTFTVGDCTVVAGDVTTPAAPALANTGSGDAGILIGGSALLLLIGGALVVARRRTVAAK